MPRMIAFLVLAAALLLVAGPADVARAQCGFGYGCTPYPPVYGGGPPYWGPVAPPAYGPPAHGYVVPAYPYFPPSGFYFGSGWDPDYRDMRYNRYFSRSQPEPQVRGYTFPGGAD